jgi:hypothetical protein
MSAYATRATSGAQSRSLRAAREKNQARTSRKKTGGTAHLSFFGRTTTRAATAARRKNPASQ